MVELVVCILICFLVWKIGARGIGLFVTGINSLFDIAEEKIKFRKKEKEV